MTDHDINSLNKLNTPEPSEDAKQRALNAALMAFDEAEQKEIKKSYQGNFSFSRLMTSYLQMTGEWIMRRSLMAGTAVALVMSVPVALFVMNDHAPKSKVSLNADKHNQKQNRAVVDCCSELKNKVTKLQNSITPNKKLTINGNVNKAIILDDVLSDQSVARKAPIAPADRFSLVGKKRNEANNYAGFRAEYSISKKQAKESHSLTLNRNDLYVGSKTYGKLSIGHSSTKSDFSREIDLSGTSPQTSGNSGVLTLGIQSSAAPAERLSSFGNTEPRFRLKGDAKPEPTTRDRYPEFKPNPVTPVRDKPVSTFSIDVDTASYALVRRSLNQGRMPNAASIRVEELINYFTYNYQLSEDAERPFKATTSVFTTPWNKHTKLLHIGIKGHDIVKKDKPRSNLVFLLDVSGSMSSQDKLPLLKSAFKLLVNKLEPEDTVSIVTYAGRSATVLKPTKVSEKQKILDALGNLKSGGSTAGAQGIQQAYKLARENFDKEGVNRVILATDGDFNVGMTNHDELKTYIEKQRKSGIFLSVLGFGQGNYNDSLMQVLAQNGNGTAAYIDSLKEAQKVLVDEAGSTLFTIAKDVKIQIEFNPKKIAEYRLIGYETRALKREDFNNDKVDAGDIGSGHTVTAIYEITPIDSPAKSVDELRYSANKKEQNKEREATSGTNEYAFLKLRYKLPKESKSKLIKIPVTTEQDKTQETLTEDTRFATAVAAFGQKIKGNQYLSDFSYDEIHNLAANARGSDTYGYRSELLSLIRLAKSLSKAQ